MGKQKKRKTQHLGDAEIWDDSALIRSWDEAVAEYEASAKTHGDHAPRSTYASLDADYEDGEIDDEDLEKVTVPSDEGDGANHETTDVIGASSVTNGNTTTTRGQPSGAKGSSQVLENIKMAYWWAGYYSGLYEGQGQTVDAMTTQDPGAAEVKTR